MRHLRNFLIEFSNLDSDIKKIFTDFFVNENPMLLSFETHWLPNTDIYETSKGIVIKMELAGVKKEDIDITYTKNKIIIKGIRHDYSIPEQIQCKQIEINYGKFERVILLKDYPDRAVNFNEIKATYKDGMLFIFVPFMKVVKPEYKIEIKEE
jgi:HSP20 family protein